MNPMNITVCCATGNKQRSWEVESTLKTDLGHLFRISFALFFICFPFCLL